MKFYWNDISKNRNSFFGFAAILVVLHHSLPFSFPNNVSAIANSVLGQFNMGVDIFLFLSGMGLHQSMKRSSVINFYKRRFFRLFPSWLLIIVPYFLICGIFFGYSLSRVLWGISTLGFWVAYESFWYFSFIIVIYLLFPLIFKTTEKFKSFYKILLVTVLLLYPLFVSILPSKYENLESAFGRIPIFLIGCIMSDFIVVEKKSIGGAIV